jgi:hypothetical protein
MPPERTVDSQRDVNSWIPIEPTASFGHQTRSGKNWASYFRRLSYTAGRCELLLVLGVEFIEHRNSGVGA